MGCCQIISATNLGVSRIGIWRYGQCEFLQVSAQCWVVRHCCATSKKIWLFEVIPQCLSCKLPCRAKHFCWNYTTGLLPSAVTECSSSTFPLSVICKAASLVSYWGVSPFSWGPLVWISWRESQRSWAPWLGQTWKPPTSHSTSCSACLHARTTSGRCFQFLPASSLGCV